MSGLVSREKVAQARRAADAPVRVRAVAPSTEPLALVDLRTASGTRVGALVLPYVGSLRILFREFEAHEALDRSDVSLPPVLDNLPVRPLKTVRRRFELPGGEPASELVTITCSPAT